MSRGSPGLRTPPASAWAAAAPNCPCLKKQELLREVLRLLRNQVRHPLPGLRLQVRLPHQDLPLLRRRHAPVLIWHPLSSCVPCLEFTSYRLLSHSWLSPVSIPIEIMDLLAVYWIWSSLTHAF